MQKEKTILGVFAALIVLAGIFFVIERLVGRGRAQPVLRRGWLTDVIYFIFTPLVTKQIVRFSLFLPLAWLVMMRFTDKAALQNQLFHGFGPLGAQPWWLQLVEVYVLGDFIGYWTHRLFHQGKWWPFHAVHHSSEDLDWLGSVRVHPVNDLVNKFAQAAPLLLLGYDPLVAASTAPFFTLYAVFLHANVNWDFGPLRGVIATPVFHRWHHSKDREAWDKNFAGLLPVWDILFGTYHMPKGRYPARFGIHEPMPESFLAQMWTPFTRAFGRPRVEQGDQVS